MSNPDYAYEVEIDQTAPGLQFFFISEGQRDIVKTIQYSYVQDLMGRQLYNLGFGDYEPETDSVLDGPISNNGDPFLVFNTVLNTIPAFFQSYPTAIMAVQGSDSNPVFIERCRAACRRRCAEGECKKAHRRINIYRRYVETDYSILEEEYTFFGGRNGIDGQIVIEEVLATMQSLY
jgi:hypothetical protein